MEPIRLLTPEDFHLCGAIWDMNLHYDLADRFYVELTRGDRVTFLWEEKGSPAGEVSLLLRSNDPDYTIPGQRGCVSHLVVRDDLRRRGIGTALCRRLFEYARAYGYEELSVGVDLDNYAALKLYTGLGFDRILLVDADDGGQYVKLLKTL